MADLQDALTRIDTGAAEARAWVEAARQSSVSVAHQSDSLIEASRRAQLAARRFQAGVGRNNCVGVFGPSQAGKSYLVSALARAPGGRLDILFGQTRQDFLRDINPPGDRESTGLVTRFTIQTGTPDPAYPVELRMLTETDLVKILANSFFLDFDPNNMTVRPVEEADLTALIQAAQASLGRAQAHLDEIALFDLTDYFQRNFSSRIGAFTRADYWRGLIDCAGRLGLADRARLFAPLWGNLPAFTDLYLHLAGALESLGHPIEARAALAGLIPRESGTPPQPSSLIDVAVLKRLQSPGDAADLVGLVPLTPRGPGAPTQIPRATLTALIAELRLVIATRPWPFFDHSDLLDFPGARSRLKLSALPAGRDEAADQTRELYLRGKVAYLFQRYTDELELTAMLLCMPPSVQEVKDLAGMVRAWIAATHGATPERRRASRNALFLVLTKHDLEFLEKGGETDASRAGKWDRRLHASFLELYGKDGWTEDWDGRPFDNTVFLRNPGMKQVHLMDYADVDSLRESGPAAASAGVIEEYRQAFTASALVQRHIADRDQVWAAALKPNDGGVSFLVDRLTRVMVPGLKTAQATERLIEVAAGLEAPLRGFHHADGDDARREKEAQLKALRIALNTRLRGADFRPFAHLLRALGVSSAALRGVFGNVAALRDTDLAPSAPADPWEDDPWSDTPKPAAPPPRRSERSGVYAGRVLNLWAQQMRALQQDALALSRLGLTGAEVGQIIDELLIGASRTGLAERIATLVDRETSIGARWPDLTDRAVRIALAQINDFVAYLGYGDQPQRPGFPEAPQPAKRQVFTLDGLRHPGPTLGPGREPVERAVFLDWGVALLSFGLDNLGHAAGREISAELNSRLGAILSRIALSDLKPAR